MSVVAEPIVSSRSRRTVLLNYEIFGRGDDFVGRTPWSAADALVGLLLDWKIFAPCDEMHCLGNVGRPFLAAAAY
jgi:hypothetical protein